MSPKCPVCGYIFPDGFEPWENGYPWQGGTSSHDICECCGLQFGYEDARAREGQETAEKIYKDLRVQWVNSGMKYWRAQNSKLKINQPPDNWDALSQLKAIDPELASIVESKLKQEKEY